MEPNSREEAEVQNAAVRHRLLRPARPWGLIALLVVLGTGFLLSWHSLTDIDVWFHQRSGNDILAGEGFPRTNTYSFTEPDHPWLNHEWLFQVLIAGLGPEPAEAGSEPAVGAWNLLRTILGVGLTLLLAWATGLLRRMQGASGSAAVWTGAALLGGLFLLWPRLTLRPELFSYAAFVLVVEGVDRLVRARPTPSSPRKLVLGPFGLVLLTALVWAQIHGFASLAPLVVILGAVLVPLERKWRGSPVIDPLPLKGWGLLLGGSLLALALTPNGPAGLLFPLRALGQFGGEGVDLRRTVSELVPLLESPGSLAWTIKAWFAALGWGLVWIVARWRAVSLLRIVLFLGTALAALTNQRNIGLFAVAFLLLHAPSSATPAPPIRLRRPGFLKPHWVALWGLVVVVAAAGIWWPSITSDRFYLHEGVGRRFGSGVNPARYPVAATAYMAVIGPDRYFANIDGAAYTLAQEASGQESGRIFIDGRTEAYSAGLWSEYLAIKAGGQAALEILARRGVEAVCLTTGSGAFRKLEAALEASEAWVLASADGGGVLYVGKKAAPRADAAAVLARGIGIETSLARGRSTVRQADHLMAAARLARQSGDTRRQRELLERALELAPGHPTVLHNLGNLRLDQEDFTEAGELFRRALDANPRLAASALNAGVCAVRLGDRRAARRHFRRAVAIDPGHFEAWMNLAVTELGLGDREAASKAAEKARELRPRARAVQDLLRRIGG